MSQFQKKYNPHRSPDWNFGGKNWRLSRSKLDFFIECPRCFYLDNKLGTGRPKGPSFTLNVAVDALFKKEFDIHRANGTAHPLMKTYGVDAVPFQHKDIDLWRDNFKGIAYTHPATGLVVSGAVDDIWINPTGELVVVDYKATSKVGKIESLADSAWEDQYRRQMGVYQWLLRNNGFPVSSTGYFVYANATTDREAFDGKLDFDVTLISCDGDTSWIDEALPKVKACLEADMIPESGPACEFCPYREAAGKALLKASQKSVTPVFTPTPVAEPVKKPAAKKPAAKKETYEEKTQQLF